MDENQKQDENQKAELAKKMGFSSSASPGTCKSPLRGLSLSAESPSLLRLLAALSHFCSAQAIYHLLPKVFQALVPAF